MKTKMMIWRVLLIVIFSMKCHAEGNGEAETKVSDGFELAGFQTISVGLSISHGDYYSLDRQVFFQRAKGDGGIIVSNMVERELVNLPVFNRTVDIQEMTLIRKKVIGLFESKTSLETKAPEYIELFLAVVYSDAEEQKIFKMKFDFEDEERMEICERFFGELIK